MLEGNKEYKVLCLRIRYLTSYSTLIKNKFICKIRFLSMKSNYI